MYAYLGADALTAIRLGDSYIAKVMQGAEVVWQRDITYDLTDGVLPLGWTITNHSLANGILMQPTYGLTTIDYPADYSDDISSTAVMVVPAGMVIKFSFDSFDVEVGTGSTCDYDHVKIYDGPDNTAELIGNYCNVNNPPPLEIESTSNSITIEFYTDTNTVESGWNISSVLATTDATNLRKYSIAGAHTFDVPNGITTINVCAIGGGGGGGQLYDDADGTYAGGGMAGVVFTGDISTTGGETLDIVIGMGGLGHTLAASGNGEAGTETTIKRGATALMTCAGGSGGVVSFSSDASYPGDGETNLENCIGTYRDGIKFKHSSVDVWGYGGQSGFGNGTDIATAGSVGFDDTDKARSGTGGHGGLGGGTAVGGEGGGTGYMLITW